MASLRTLLSQIKAALQKHTAPFRPPAMIGTRPSARPIWHNPAAHARDFSERYAEDIDLAIANRKMELGIPNHQIGRPDPDHRAADTPLKIREKARERLLEMADAERRRTGR
jgi:hypothetical protein